VETSKEFIEKIIDDYLNRRLFGDYYIIQSMTVDHSTDDLRIAADVVAFKPITKIEVKFNNIGEDF
jgi:hypothetical protein